MARINVGFAIWSALLLATTAVAQGQCPDCECSPYPDFAYDPCTAAPMPGESPSSYFTRQYHRSRGPYGEFATQYEVFPEQWEADSEGAPLESSPDQFASFNNAEPSDFSQSYVEDYAAETSGPTNQKPGLFQKWAFRATHIPGGGADSLGITDLETWVVFGLPCPTRDNPLLITPGYAYRSLDVPGAIDLPDALYDIYVQFRWLGKWNDCWGYDLVVTPGIYSDLETSDSDEEFRLTGRAVATYEWSPWTQVAFGVGYFNREDFNLLPIAGMIYTPCEDVRWEFIFPRPRYARRYYAACDREDWWYIVGEFGGGSWAIERTGGADDVVTLRDYRLMVGKEAKLNGGAGRSVEVGYVFGREVEYRSATPTIELDSSFVIRGAITF